MRGRLLLYLPLMLHAQTNQRERSCVTCHPAQTVAHASSAMAHALEPAEGCTILRGHLRLEFASGAYTYRIERRGKTSVYTVSDGKESVTATLQWAVGLGAAGQTYVYEHQGELYQSRVSFYQDIDGLDLTLGATNAHPTDLTDAAGQRMTHEDKVACFGCHATRAVVAKEFSPQTMTPGVQCERCHGAAGAHVDNLKPMPSLRGMTAEQMSTFCGQCHRTWEQIAVSGIHGVVNVRFQPYRLANSKCYDPDDARISCVACHDPHAEVKHDTTAYDAKCLACHGNGVGRAKMCKVQTGNCASCHMPKTSIPGAHHQFTDHAIRIVRADAPYPD